MTRGSIALANVRRVAIAANKVLVLINGCQLVVKILAQPILIVTLTARRDRHVGLETSQRGRLRNVDMTGGAFGRMVLLCSAAVVAELHREPLRRFGWHIRRRGGLMAAGAVLSRWLLTLPMTIETQVMTRRRRFEGIGRRHICIGPTADGRHQSTGMGVTNRAVVVFSGSVVSRMRGLNKTTNGCLRL